MLSTEFRLTAGAVRQRRRPAFCAEFRSTLGVAAEGSGLDVTTLANLGDVVLGLPVLAEPILVLGSSPRKVVLAAAH